MTQVHFALNSEEVQRNGYYDRNYTTRVGKFSPTIVERYQRNEKALLASMIEMDVSCVSTRRVSKIFEELCGKSVSKSFVSSLTDFMIRFLDIFFNISN